ncbi:MAG: CocE/NonD family hydrolase [Candidatus Latescibacteria bacterium]|nr:CocE/NonD family hydrolase [Candidatus Latescibacterota bacterium]
MSTSQTEHWISMNDGVKLDASIFTPEGDPPKNGWPAILFAHGHGDAGNKTSYFARAQQYAKQGYLTISFSVRGQGNSEGLVFHMGPREIFDLQDVISWSLNEFPINKLAVMGSSQGGWHAYMAAAHHPQVATVVAENIFTQYNEFAVHNGCLAKWFFTRTMRRRILTAGLQDITRQWALDGDWFRIQEWVKPTSPMLFANRIKCPIFIVHGWHDIGMPPNEVVTLFNKIIAPKKLYLGGGGHDGLDSATAQNIRTELTDRWLDHWLKDKDTGLMDEPAITYAQRPGWHHIATNTMPPTNVQTKTFYLSAQTPEQSVPEDPNTTFEILRPQPIRSLTNTAPEQPSIHSNITNRPLNPDYTLKDALNDDMAGVPEALAKEVISFASTPFETPTEMIGSPVAKLFVMPNRPQIQVVVDLYDVSPDGERTLITRGQFGTRTAQPGQHLTINIETRTIGYLIAAGHHLLLDVSNYDTTYAFPYFEPSVARLYHDNQFSSAIEIPIKK